MEYWPDNFNAFKLATEKGIIVVEAAGNGGVNFDDPFYNQKPPGFPPSWKNPFNRTIADSGLIVCGAGAPPSGGFGPDRSRLSFSNYGNMVDSQGYGRGVVTTGYGDLFRGQGENQRLYTATFSGTSSASPIVTGTVISLQGIAKARNKLLSPLQMRQILRAHKGSPQTGPRENIGQRPDLAEMLKEFDRIFK